MSRRMRLHRAGARIAVGVGVLPRKESATVMIRAGTASVGTDLSSAGPLVPAAHRSVVARDTKGRGTLRRCAGFILSSARPFAGTEGVVPRSSLAPRRAAALGAVREATRAIALILPAMLAAGCASQREPIMPPSPEQPWRVPDTGRYSALATAPPKESTAEQPAFDAEKRYALAELIDIAQRVNPDTRISWERAREAAAALGMTEAEHMPMLAAQAVGLAQRVPLPFPKSVLTPDGFFTANTRAFLPGLTLKWLLYDFGGHEAAVSARREQVAMANFGFNATHQKVAFDVTRAYYTLDTVQGRVEVARTAYKLAQTLQDAAESRQARGLATRPEVLQAREQRARANYDMQEALAAENDGRMALLEAIGLRPTLPLRIADTSQRALPATFEDTADKLIDRALAQRPDLLARAAAVRAREAEVKKAQAAFLPSIAVAANVAQNIGRISIQNIPGSASVNEPTWGGTIGIEIPLYDFGLRRSRVDAARAQQRIAEAELEVSRDRTMRQVAKAWEDFKVAQRKREAAEALVTAADASYAATFDSYRHGIASFVDVLNAQTSLVKARTALTDARSSVFVSAAALAFSTGDLALDGTGNGASSAETPDS